MEYLGRYTHRVAISNNRILKVTDTHVTFRWNNRQDGYKHEVTTITGVEFLKRFLEHIVPPYFRRIRHLGFLSTRSKQKSLELIRNNLDSYPDPLPALSRAQLLALRWGERSELKCKGCGGELQLWKTFLPKQAPPISA